MNQNPYIHYYSQQAGTGIAGFQGVRFQRGAGFFGNIFRSAILPVLKYFGKTALNTGVQVAGDAIGGENVLESLRNRGKQAARTIANDAAERATRFAQTGTGKRRRSKRVAKSIKKRRRTQKSSTKKLKVKRRRRSSKSKNLTSIFN